MLSPRPPHTLPVVLLVGALQVLCALGGPTSVLCVEQDGCVAIELGRESCCLEDGRRAVEARAPDRPAPRPNSQHPAEAGAHPSGADGGCLACTDIRIAAGDQHHPRRDAPRLCSAPSPPSGPAALRAPSPARLSAQTPAALLSFDRHPLQALGTVVLRR